MRILFVHNYYGSSSPSGENVAVEAEMELLRKRGHEVTLFSRNSDELRKAGAFGMVRGAFATPWNPWMVRAVRAQVNEFRPDVMHVHNTFPLVSPSILYGVESRAARVVSLHNYRLFCAAAIPMRAGRICTECLEKKSVVPALKYGCYRDSRVATLPLALSVSLHRYLRTWSKMVDAFVALTEFQRDQLVRAGLPRECVLVKPNFYPGAPEPVPWKEREDYAVFAGRLTPEKGVDTLVQAWIKGGAELPELRIIGDGDHRAVLQRKAAAAGRRVRFLGQMTSAEAERQIAKAKLLVLPSECFEGFPMVLREAFAFGTPAAVSDLGALPLIVRHGENGVVFAPRSPESLLHEVRRALRVEGALEQMGAGARLAYERAYNEDANYLALLAIYERALAKQRTRKG